MKFSRPKGAVKDFKELEYLVALHQTSHDELESFVDGSIDAKDVSAFLMSRYGIAVTETQVREMIFKGLAGGDGEDEEIDIIEIVAILMIPMLVKVSDGILGDEPGFRESSLDEDQKRLLPPESIIEDVLRDIIRDTTDGAYDVEHPPPLTPSLLKKIFLEYDELDLVSDDALIEQMINMVCEECQQDSEIQESQSEPVVLDVKAFAKALTKDTHLYNPENETRYSEVFDDVFHDGLLEAAKKGKEEDEEGNTGFRALDRSPSLAGDTILRVAVFSHVDFTADNFVHVVHVVLIWMVVVFTYFFYMTGINQPEFATDIYSTFWSKIGYAIFRWIITMLKLIIFGTGIGFLLALGNGLFENSILQPIIGLAAVALLVFVPHFVRMSTIAFDTDLSDPSHEHHSYPELLDMMLIFGSLIVCVQVKNMVTIIFGKGNKLKNNPAFAFMESILGSNVSRAYRSKQAAVYKINEMARNAYDLHQMDLKALERTELKREVNIEGSDSQTKTSSCKQETRSAQVDAFRSKSSREIALQKYNDLVDESEEVGGAVWAWKEYVSGNLGMTEGVWLPSRLIAANTILFVAIFVVLYIMSLIFIGLDTVLDQVYNDLQFTEPEPNSECFSVFDYGECYFPFEESSFYTGAAICRNVSLSGPRCRELFEPIDQETTFGSAVGNLCDTVEKAFSPFEKQVADMLGGAACSYVLDAAKASVIDTLAPFNISADDAVGLYNNCYTVKYMSDEDITKFNEWFDDDTYAPDITEEDLMDCALVESIVSNETFVDSYQGREEFAYLGFQLCMEIYRSLTPSPLCEQPLYRPVDTIVTYEKNSNSSEFCASYLSICVPDKYNPARGTCVIGEADNEFYGFGGTNCEDYPRINNTLNFYYENVEPLRQAALDFLPKRWMIAVTAAVGVISGLLSALFTSLIYIPSSIHTVLKFRSGVIPSLKDPKFISYRKNAHYQTVMIGAMFWGLLLTTALVTAVSGGVMFLLLWPVTNPIFLDILSQGIGIGVTILLKTVATYFALKASYAGFYRTKPMFANIFCFALECWNLALTLFVIVTRLVKFVAAASIYVGRVDKDVLADGLLFQLDSLPAAFRKNLLSTESHRHPYIEMLGQMYLMKIRHRDQFGSKAGSIWRLLFVSALMPWLKKKRIQDQDVDIDNLRSAVGKEAPEEVVQGGGEQERDDVMKNEVEEDI